MSAPSALWKISCAVRIVAGTEHDIFTNVGTVGTLEDIMFGPSHNADGTTNYIGALRRAMATTGYVDLKSFQRCPVTVAPTR